VSLEARRSLQLGDNRTQRAVGLVGRALIAQARVRFPRDAPGESRCKAGLADPRLARNQNDLPFALPGEALALQQEIDLVLAANEVGQFRHADCLEATLGVRNTLDRPRCDRLGKALDLVPAEVAQTEQIAEQSARRDRDDNSPPPPYPPPPLRTPPASPRQTRAAARHPRGGGRRPAPGRWRCRCGPRAAPRHASPVARRRQ